MAGESAREIARRRREKAERLNRVAEKYEQGAAGEQATADALKALPPGWRVMHDVKWPGRRFANIDHVVIGPSGIYVVDSKLWTGTLTVINGVLRQNGYKRETAVAGVADSGIAVAELVPGLDPYLVKPVLCFVRDQELTGTVRDVLICSTANIVTMLTTRASVLDDTALRNIHGWLAGTLQRAAPVHLPASSPPARRPLPAPRTKVARRSPGRRGPSFAKGCLGLALLAVLLLGGGSFIARVVGEGVARAVQHPSMVPVQTDGQSGRPLGVAVRYARGTHRPPLRVVVDRARTTRSIQGLHPLLQGDRLFAVRVRITNAGRHPWVSEPGTTAVVTDGYDTPHPADNRYSLVRAGRSFEPVIRLKPGGSLRRVFVFELAADVPVTRFSLTVGPGQPSTASWVIDRQ